MASADCAGVINNLADALSLNPNNNYYQQYNLFFSFNCLQLIKDKSLQTDFINNILSQIKAVKDKDHYDLRLNLARAYAGLGFYFDKIYYGEAEKIFSQLILTYPNLTTAYEDFGKQKIMQEDYAGAIEIFKQALAVLPPTDKPYLNNQHRR